MGAEGQRFAALLVLFVGSMGQGALVPLQVQCYGLEVVCRWHLLVLSLAFLPPWVDQEASEEKEVTLGCLGWLPLIGET